MKKKCLLLATLFISGLITTTLVGINNVPTKPAKASIGTKSIDISDDSESSIRSYYADAAGKRGKQLLTALKPILKNNHSTLTYDEVWQAYRITDRDWIQSPLSSSQLASYSHNDDPYLVLLYRTDNYTNTAAHMSDSHTSVINREHVWAKSIGDFDTNAPAGTDLHHLIAADVDNNGAHSNYNYGEPTSITKTPSQIGKSAYNKTGTLGTVSYGGSTYTVYEPQDCDKGDIARALMYMAARYSSYTSASDPYLELVDYPTAGTTFVCDATHPGQQGTISTLLKWHKQDPADDYEIHRNNLIDNNYQHNRNPFIDYPELADIAFGDGSDTFSPSTQTVRQVGDNYGTEEKTPKSLSITGQTTSFITGKYLELGSGTLTVTYTDNSTKQIQLNDTKVTITINGVNYSKGSGLTTSQSGTVVISYTENSVTKSVSYSITVNQAVEDITLSTTTPYIHKGDSLTLTSSVTPNNAYDKSLTWSSKFTDVATVNSSTGSISTLKNGFTQITATANDGSGVSASYNLHVYQLADNQIDEMYEFDKGPGFSSWSTTRAAHTFEYDDCVVTFDSANKSNQVIKDVPVTANKAPVYVEAKDGKTITDIEFICKQWNNDTVQLSVSASDDNGATYIDQSGYSNRFDFYKTDLPTGTNKVRLNFSSNSYVGIQGLRIKFAGGEPTPEKTLESISLGSSAPNKTSYEVGEEFDPTGLVVTATYSDSSTAVVTSSTTWNYGVLNSTAITSVTGSYTYKGITKTATYNGITVSEPSGPYISSLVYYEKVSSNRSDWSGKYLLSYNDSVAWTGVDVSSCNVSVDVSNNKINTKPSSAVELDIQQMTGGYSIKVVGSTNDGKYIGGVNESNTIKYDSSALLNTISYSNDEISIVSETSVLRYNSNSGQERFRYFKGSTYTNQKAIQLYRAIYLTDLIQDWADDYMHMSSNVSGQCNTYYVLAKAALRSLENSYSGAITELINNSTFNSVQARYEAWAIALGDQAPYVGSTISHAKTSLITDNGTDLILVLIATSSTLSIGAFIFFGKKKKQYN